tara:strand:- start:5223 stop:5864 length:642 start_codon:yes stop_codon:yes gene_type:complete
MELDLDARQRIKIFFLFIFQVYKIIMGSFLVIFVPQQCGDHDCTMYELSNPNENYGQLFIMWNVLTLLSFLYLYLVELRRENWMITYLDHNDDLMSATLDPIDNEYETQEMTKMNQSYINAVQASIFAVFFNIVLSGMFIHAHYKDATTVTSFSSFILLVSSKIYSSYNIAKESHDEMRALSAYITKPMLFNVLDESICTKSIVPASFLYHPI